MNTETNNSSKKIDEALQLLNEAARDKKEEVQRLFTDKYSHVKNALREVTIKNKEIVDRAIQEGEEKIKEVVADVDQKVRSNPWPYIGGVALGALLLGYILGNSKDR